MRRFQRLSEDVKLPTRATKCSAGYDFYAPRDILVPARGRSELVNSGVIAVMEDGEYLDIRIRSGLAIKHGLNIPLNPVIDADFLKPIGLIFENHFDTDYVIKKGERCCQGIFTRYMTVEGDNVTEERSSGFGSTGTR